MKSRLLHDDGGQRTFVLVFDTDDEVMKELLSWTGAEKISGASFTAIGAFRRVTLGYFDIEKRSYAHIPLEEQVEVLALTGNVALAKGKPKIHAHVVVGLRDGTAHGGHLIDATVRPTLELVLVESAPYLRRSVDEATGLALIDLNRRS